MAHANERSDAGRQKRRQDLGQPNSRAELYVDRTSEEPAHRICLPRLCWRLVVGPAAFRNGLSIPVAGARGRATAACAGSACLRFRRTGAARATLSIHAVNRERGIPGLRLCVESFERQRCGEREYANHLFTRRSIDLPRCALGRVLAEAELTVDLRPDTRHSHVDDEGALARLSKAHAIGSRAQPFEEAS